MTEMSWSSFSESPHWTYTGLSLCRETLICSSIGQGYSAVLSVGGVLYCTHICIHLTKAWHKSFSAKCGSSSSGAPFLWRNFDLSAEGQRALHCRGGAKKRAFDCICITAWRDYTCMLWRSFTDLFTFVSANWMCFRCCDTLVRLSQGVVGTACLPPWLTAARHQPPAHCSVAEQKVCRADIFLTDHIWMFVYHFFRSSAWIRVTIMVQRDTPGMHGERVMDADRILVAGVCCVKMALNGF